MKCSLEPNTGLFRFLPRKSGKVRKHRGHQVAVMGVGRRQAGGIQVEHVTRLGHRLEPRGGRCGEDLDLTTPRLSRSTFASASSSAITRRISVAFCAAMPRCLSNSIGLSVTRRTRIDTLRVGQIDRTDRDHLHRGSLRRRAGHHDHGGDPPEARKRKAFDHLLVGDDFVSSRCELPVDTLDAEGMPEMNRFPSRARGHAGSPANLRAKS